MGRLSTFNQLAQLSYRRALTPWEKFSLWADVLWERFRYKTEIQDYFQYEFYKLKSCERRKYMTFSKLRYTIRVCNDPQKREIFDDKALFNSAFGSFLNREWLDITTASLDEFRGFAERHAAFFAKARSGMFGKNAGRYDAETYNTPDKLEALYKQLKTNNCIVEELISQHPSLEMFNSSSVNTLRVVTLRCADGTPKVMAGVLRIGRAGKSADNFHHHGIAATIDVECGVVNALGIDRDFKRYIIHPDSGEQIIGFQIPFWDRIVETVCKAATVIPEVRYIGWDIAIDRNGNIQVVEGNYGADPDVTQMPRREGMWPLFKKELDQISKNG